MQSEQEISKPTNRPTSILMLLLKWLTNLELSGSSGKEQDVGNLKTIPIFESSLKREKEMKRAMRDNLTQENDYNGEFHLAIKKQTIGR